MHDAAVTERDEDEQAVRNATRKKINRRRQCCRGLRKRATRKPMRSGSIVPSIAKNLKKCLAMAAGIVTTGVILRAFGEYMRKFKRFPPRGLRFRSLLVLAGALI